ncbi:SHOCT domain-containing protein [Natrinema soli]|uniref:SHOCT domain-containing protein n=1 Tax=Natrinema soli TaxID=1930624 RepID=A0ABD5SV77_9EURY|nr:SHOCT domain-containing protein [Natrinema soli]
MGRLSSLLLRGIGVLLLVLIALSVVGTIVGIALSLVVVVLSVIVSLTVLGLFVLAIVGLFSVFGGDSAAGDDACPPQRSDDRTAPEDRVRSRYVDGELDDDEFERELERVLGPDERTERTGLDRSNARSTDRRRLRDR